MEKKKVALSKGEIFSYVVAGLLALGGLSLILTGIIGTHLGVPPTDNPITGAEAALLGSIGIGFRWLGVIILLVGVVIAVIALSAFAKKEDRDEERNARRRERMQILSASASVPEAVEVKAEPKKEE